MPLGWLASFLNGPQQPLMDLYAQSWIAKNQTDYRCDYIGVDFHQQNHKSLNISIICRGGTSTTLVWKASSLNGPQQPIMDLCAQSWIGAQNKSNRLAQQLFRSGVTSTQTQNHTHLDHP